MRGVDDKYSAVCLEEASLLRKIDKIRRDEKQHASKIAPSAGILPLKYCDINSIPKNIGSLADTLLRSRSNGLGSNGLYNHAEADVLH